MRKVLFSACLFCLRLHTTLRFSQSNHCSRPPSLGCRSGSFYKHPHYSTVSAKRFVRRCKSSVSLVNLAPSSLALLNHLTNATPAVTNAPIPSTTQPIGPGYKFKAPDSTTTAFACKRVAAVFRVRLPVNNPITMFFCR